MAKEIKIPGATIERISLYSRPLERISERGVAVVSSEQLAQFCNVNPAQVRKDLSYFGEFGVRGIGYDVQDLLREIKKILVSDREWRVGIVGLGNLGTALVQDENFLNRGYKFVAAFDADPSKIGLRLPGGLVIEPPAKIGPLTRVLGIEVGLIATQSSEAEGVAKLLVEAGIKAILNFAPIQLRQRRSCIVENVDFTVSLDNLAYHLNQSDEEKP